jgi:CheY-like chemotaxis protein
MISRLVRNLYGTETILVVEDEDALRTLIQKILEQHGYTVLVAGDGQEAMRICEAHQDTIELLFTDTVLPGMNGLEFADRVLDLLPQIKVVYASGYPDMAAGDMGLHHLKGPFIQKPFTPDVLTRVVREALDS